MLRTQHSRGKDNLLIHAPKLSVSTGSYLANEAVSAASNVEFRPWPPLPAPSPSLPPPLLLTTSILHLTLSPSTPPPTHPQHPVKKLREPLCTKLTYLYTCIFISERNQIETVHEQQGKARSLSVSATAVLKARNLPFPMGLSKHFTRMQERKWKACSLKGKNTFGVEIF